MWLFSAVHDQSRREHSRQGIPQYRQTFRSGPFRTVCERSPPRGRLCRRRPSLPPSPSYAERRPVPCKQRPQVCSHSEPTGSRPYPMTSDGAFGAPVACIGSVVLRRQTAGGPSFHRRRRIGRPGHRIVRDDRTGILNQIAVGYHIQHGTARHPINRKNERIGRPRFVLGRERDLPPGIVFFIPVTGQAVGIEIGDRVVRQRRPTTTGMCTCNCSLKIPT